MNTDGGTTSGITGFKTHDCCCIILRLTRAAAKNQHIGGNGISVLVGKIFCAAKIKPICIGCITYTVNMSKFIFDFSLGSSVSR